MGSLKHANRKDSRYRNADKAIRDAFSNLIATYPLEEVTASMIIGHAHVNRSTFYAHYQDKYDLMRQMQLDLIGEIAQMTHTSPALPQGPTHGTDGSLNEYFTGVLSFLGVNGKLLSTFLKQGDGTFMCAFRKTIQEMWAPPHPDGNLAMPPEYTAAVFAGALSGFIEQWVAAGCPEDDRYVDMLVSVAARMPAVFLSES